MFRTLKASEIDVRVATVKEKGLSLLLYKDARADMIVLDETVGAFNWKREHTRDNANCIVSIWDKDKSQWISKEDTGAESFTEKEKGLASDSFKRACFNWGIGRELYTAPFIWVTNAEIKGSGNKFTCYDKFEVVDIEYDENRNINYLAIVNIKTYEKVFEFKANKKPDISDKQVKDLLDLAKGKNITEAGVKRVLYRDYGINDLKRLTKEQYKEVTERISKAEAK